MKHNWSNNVEVILPPKQPLEMDHEGSLIYVMYKKYDIKKEIHLLCIHDIILDKIGLVRILLPGPLGKHLR